MDRLVIGLVGRKGSGKGTVAKILQEKYGATLFRFSGVLGDILNRLSLPLTHDNMIRLSEILRQEFDEDVLKNAIMADVAKHDGELIVLDGVRRIQDLEKLDQLGNFRLISVTAPLEVRYERVIKRGEKVNEAEMSFEDFKNMQANAPTEVTIGEVETRAWKTLENSGSLEELENQIASIMHELTL